MPRSNRFPTAPRSAKARLRVESLEQRVVPASALADGFVGPVAVEKVRVDGPPLVAPPQNMPGLADLDVTIAAAVRNAWRVPAGTATARWVIQLPAGQSPDVLEPLGGTAVRAVPYWANTYEFRFADPRDVAAFPAALADVTAPGFYYPVIERLLEKRFFPTDPLADEQWHLRNTGQGGGTPGEDARLEAAWDVLGPDGQAVRGNGVVIGIVDDGLQRTHPDLAANYVAADSFDFNDNDPDPSPNISFDWHGTAAAGVAAARAMNGVGLSGSAPEASLAGIRLISAPVGDPEEAAALQYHPNSVDIYSNSWGPADIGTLGAIGPETLAALAAGYATGRNGLGNIFTWAAGNGLGSNDNVNYDAYANARYVIAVGAVTDTGLQASYSEPGAPMLVTAQSSGGVTDIYTTDITGSQGYGGLPDLNYTNGFGGTSSATPLVSGIVALMLDANPDLTARDVQNILVRTARKNDPTDSGWSNNGAGFHVNHKYGFGAIDAAAAVALARTWSPVAAEQTISPGQVAVNQAIPDNDPTGVTSTVNVPQNISVEHVEVVFNATHTYRGDLRIVLTSPSGTESVLAESHLQDGAPDYPGWVFSSVRHWGESSQGTWTIKVIDGLAQDNGTFDNWTLRIHGTTFGSPPGLTGMEAAPLTYIAGQGQVPVTQTLTPTDPDDPSLAGGTVSITGNYTPGQDFLRFTNTANISGTFDAGSGILSLSGTATLAQYQAALRAVRYENTSATPSTATRKISFRVSDPGGLVSSARTRDIAISLVNKQPTLNAIADPAAVNEDAGPQTVNLSGIGAGAGETQTLTVTATSSNPAVVPDPTVTYSSPGATGTLSYTPAADQSGTAVITVRVRDDGGTLNGGVDEVTRTFTVTVNSSNDAPTFTPGPNLFVGLNAGPQTFTGWATGVSAGPPNESGQTLQFNVTNNANALFDVHPAIAPDGTLTYTPANGAVGPATVSVTLADNGGTANGGDDTSETITFTIEIDVNDAPTVVGDAVTKLTAVPKYKASPAGDPVTILGGTITDPDANQSEGIAVVGLTGTAVGTWEYSLDGGATWVPFGAVSAAAARLVGEDDLVRFVPTQASAGSAELTYHAWDQFTNAPGDVVDLTAAGATGGQTAFSVATARARVRVAPAMTTVVEDSPKNKGDKVGTLLATLAADADLKAKKGMAITGFSATTPGTWQYSTTGGRKWLPLPAVSLANALLLSDKDKLRFVPGPEQSGEAAVTYRAWD
ncbi:MAG TPA: S8 family serine peptidase, partial [Gemmataceae bacterium]|nr:S8 family serine peptidase [Gemmataceae bacterium]